MGILYGWWREQETQTPPKLKEVLDDVLVAHAHAENRRHMQKIESRIATLVDKTLGVLYPIEGIEYVPRHWGIAFDSGDYYRFRMAGATWRYHYNYEPEGLFVETPSGDVVKIDDTVDLYRALEK